MPKKMAMLDYGKCNPAKCENGICLAVLACRHKLLSQEMAYELPDTPLTMCMGCNLCVRACPLHAIQTQ